jgi:hypothetical protein
LVLFIVKKTLIPSYKNFLGSNIFPDNHKNWNRLRSLDNFYIWRTWRTKTYYLHFLVWRGCLSRNTKLCHIIFCSLGVASRFGIVFLSSFRDQSDFIRNMFNSSVFLSLYKFIYLLCENHPAISGLKMEISLVTVSKTAQFCGTL